MVAAPTPPRADGRWSPTAEAMDAVLAIIKESKYGITLNLLCRAARAQALTHVADDNPSDTALYHRLYKITNILLDQQVIRRSRGGVLEFLEGSEGQFKQRVFEETLRQALTPLLGQGSKNLEEDLGYLRAAFTGVVEDLLSPEQPFNEATQKARSSSKLLNALAQRKKPKA